MFNAQGGDSEERLQEDVDVEKNAGFDSHVQSSSSPEEPSTSTSTTPKRSLSRIFEMFHEGERNEALQRQGYIDTGDDSEEPSDMRSTNNRLGAFCRRIHSLPWTNSLGTVSPSNHHSSGQEKTQTPTYRIFPIFSGIVVPFSILLSIPSLTEHWYVRTGPDGKLIETRPNPRLLDVAIATSMTCALVACACLVSRFTERKVKLMTLLCIIFLTVHDIFNITVVTIFGVQHRFDDGFTYGQAFWMTVCSTIASTITNVTLMIDYFRTPDFDNSGSGLTHKQRSLVIIVIILLCYIAIGALILAFLLKLSFIDALYLTVVSIETIGFGDIHPNTPISYVIVCTYVTFGIINLALAVALSRDAIMEAVSVNLQARMRAIRVRDRERRINLRWRKAVKWRLRARRLPVWVADKSMDRWWNIFCLKRKTEATWKYTPGPRRKRLNIEGLTLAQLEAAALEAGAPLVNLLPAGYSPRVVGVALDSGQEPLTYVRIGGMIAMLGRFALAMGHSSGRNSETPVFDTDDDDQDDSEGIASGRGHGVPFTRTTTMEPDLFEATVEAEEKAAFYARLSCAFGLFLLFWMAGSAIFMTTESWTFGQAVYFCFVAFTTLGYGDFSPRTPAGRSIFVVWALLGVGAMTILISIVSEAYSKQYQSAIRAEVYQRRLNAFVDRDTVQQRFLDSRTAVDHSFILSTVNRRLGEQITSMSTNAEMFTPHESADIDDQSPQAGQSVSFEEVEPPLPLSLNMDAIHASVSARSGHDSHHPSPIRILRSDLRRTRSPTEASVGALAHHILQHVQHVQSLLGADTALINPDRLTGNEVSSVEGWELRMSSVEASLRELVVVAKEALATNNPEFD